MTHLLRTYDRGVLRVTLNRPAKRNALSREALRELRTVFLGHGGREDVRLAVIAGAGELAFCSGGDLEEFASVQAPEDARALAAEGAGALDAIRAFPVPTVAALNGVALGGGAELALACDLRIAAPHAGIGFTHALLNVSTAWGGGPDLARAVGAGAALELLATGRTLSAEEARAAGLVQHVAPRTGAFVDFVDRFAGALAERPPHLLRALKSLALAGRPATTEAMQRAVEEGEFVRTWTHGAHWAAAEARAARRR
jgi:enoyl-CoA hydratase/carnithine racemase